MSVQGKGKAVLQGWFFFVKYGINCRKITELESSLNARIGCTSRVYGVSGSGRAVRLFQFQRGWRHQLVGQNTTKRRVLL